LSPDEGSEPYTYARAGHPGWDALEAALAELELTGGAPARVAVTGAGMAAITVLLRAVLRAGDVLVVPSDGYYQVRAYAREVLAPFGVEVREAPTTGMADAVAGARLVLAETPSNPRLDVVDLAALAEATHAAGGLLAVDGTTATPLGQSPLALGADAVVVSATKSLTGHSDVLAGYVATTDEELAARVARERALSGSVLGPFETWLAHRSLGSAGLRFDRQCTTAAAVAELLAGHPAATGVRWPGLPDDPSHAVAAAQMRRFGAIVSADLGSAQRVHDLVAASDLLTAATSFGGLGTTVDRRARWGDDVPPGFARFSCGIEDTADVVADLAAALDALR
jgi:cystathionine gamma-lyase